MDQNSSTGLFTEEQMDEHVEKLFKYKTRLANFISSFTEEEFKLIENRLGEEEKSSNKIDRETKDFLNKKFQLTVKINEHGRTICCWQTKYKFKIIFDPCWRDRHWSFEYNDSLVYYKTKDIRHTGACLDPTWIPNLIERLEKDPKKLETKPEAVIWLENKYDMESELWPDLFGQWLLTLKVNDRNTCPYFSADRYAFKIQIFSNNPFNTPAMSTDQKRQWTSGSSKFNALYWNGYPIHMHDQSKEDIVNFVNEKKNTLTTYIPTPHKNIHHK